LSPIAMGTYIVNPAEVRMREDERGTLYPAIVCMGMRANDLAVQIRQKLEERIADLIGEPGDDGDVAYGVASRRLQEEQLRIALEFEQIPKPTFLAMKERYEGKLEYRIPETPETPAEPAVTLPPKRSGRTTR